ncbi:copper resistance CopC family protein [Lentzea sp. CA-135723]|uniref:copper resistance CopC family protein n=1 Tax=Lentzea sp. CA-135723 TaxID=3239950 RepID=UPI003D8F4C06
MRYLLVLAITLLSVLAATPSASAHTQLTSSDPANGAQVAAPLQQITLTFNEPVAPDSTTVTVTGPDGAAWQIGQITGKDATLTVPVTPAGPAGEYVLNFKIGSADDHAVTGSLKFAMTVPATTTTTAPPTTTTTTTPSAAPSVAPAAQSTQDSGIPWWIWLVVVLVVVAVAVVVLATRKKRTV